VRPRDWAGPPGLLRLLPPGAPRLLRGMQALAILVALTQVAIDLSQGGPRVSLVEVAPVVLFMSPVLYAVGVFDATGRVGAATALLFLALLDGALLQHGLHRWSDALEVGIVATMAVCVGQRVASDLAVRRRARAAEEDRQLSETAYRALFAESHTPILLVGDDGLIRDANVAAKALFATPPVELSGRPLAALFGPDMVRRLLVGPSPDAITVRDAAGADLVLRPIRTCISMGADRRLVQLVLRDLTEERRHQLERERYVTSLLQGQEEQRRQLAQELHDQPVQALIAVCHRLDLVPQRASLPADTVASLEQTRAVVERTVQELRELARGLRPPTLDDLGLATSLRHLLDELEERTGVRTRLTVRAGERRLGPEVEGALFRIAQEAVCNVERHAAAGRLWVEVAFDRGVRLTVRDDGRGSRPTPAGGTGTRTGLGLLGLRERATLLRGQLDITSSPGRGTTVRVKIPPLAARTSGHGAVGAARHNRAQRFGSVLDGVPASLAVRQGEGGTDRRLAPARWDRPPTRAASGCDGQEGEGNGG
jgi:signal transduction histidine kinase